MYNSSRNYCINRGKIVCSSAFLCLGTSGHHAHLWFLSFLRVLLLGGVNLPDIDIQAMPFKVAHHLFFVVYILDVFTVGRDFQLELHLFRGGGLVRILDHPRHSMVAHSGEARHDHQISCFQFNGQRFLSLLGVAQQEHAAESIAVREYRVDLVNLAIIQVANHIILWLVIVNNHGLPIVVNLDVRNLLEYFDSSLCQVEDGLGDGHLRRWVTSFGPVILIP